MPDVESPPVTEASVTSSSVSQQDSNIDSVLASHPRRGGYRRVAELFASEPNLAIVRRFGHLNSLNLLYLQAELVKLEDDLKYWADQDDNSSDSRRRDYRHSWRSLSKGLVDEGPANRNNQQLQIVRRMRALLKEYSKPSLEVTALC